MVNWWLFVYYEKSMPNYDNIVLISKEVLIGRPTVYSVERPPITGLPGITLKDLLQDFKNSDLTELKHRIQRLSHARRRL